MGGRPLRRRWSCLALLSILISGAMLAACSSSDSSSKSSASTRDRSRGLCTLITPAEVRAITGFTVGTPASVLQGATTDCAYAAANPSHIVSIRYNTSATASSFDTKRDAIAPAGESVTAISDVGQQAFVYSGTAGATRTTTVVARQGTVMVEVTGTAATPGQLEALAQKALGRAS
jgi:hypothetical protein